MSGVSRRDDTRTFGQGGELTDRVSRQSGSYPGRHASTPRKAARWARKAAPAAAIAATLAAGAAAYGLTGSSQPDPGKMTAALSVPIDRGAVAHGSAGKAGSADADSVLVSARAASDHARAARHHARTARHPHAKRTAPAVTARHRPAAAPSQRPAAAPSPSATSAPAASGVSCATSSGMLPDNVTAIVSFLISHGYSHNAAAGIAGNIYQESKGDPESVGMGGGGLIGWTPLPTGYVTGNTAADLQTQLSALLTFNQGWASYLPALNAAATPAAAADIYVTDFERAGIPAAGTREASAQAVASACGL